jgi:membrane-bound serine protease (ClpP class)
MNIYIWPSILLLAAFLLMGLEIFVPSMGLLPLLCLGLFGASLWSAFSISFTTGLVFLAIDLAITPILVFIGASLWPHTPLAKLFTLSPPGTDETILEKMAAAEKSDIYRFVGTHGRAMTDLRPGGIVELFDQPMDAVTDEGYIEAGRFIRVIGIRQSQLLVRQQLPSEPKV